jgi:hypothetical protein
MNGNGLAMSSSVQTSLYFSFYSANLAKNPKLLLFNLEPKLLLIAIVSLRVFRPAFHSIVKFRVSISNFNSIIRNSAVIQSSNSTFCRQFVVKFRFQFPIQRQIPRSDCQFSISFRSLVFSSVFYSTRQRSIPIVRFRFRVGFLFSYNR